MWPFRSTSPQRTRKLFRNGSDMASPDSGRSRPGRQRELPRTSRGSWPAGIGRQAPGAPARSATAVQTAPARSTAPNRASVGGPGRAAAKAASRRRRRRAHDGRTIERDEPVARRGDVVEAKDEREDADARGSRRRTGRGSRTGRGRDRGEDERRTEDEKVDPEDSDADAGSAHVRSHFSGGLPDR